MISTNVNGVLSDNIVFHVTQRPSNPREELAFDIGTNRHLKCSVLEREGRVVRVWKAERSVHRLKHKDLPNPCEDLAPSAFTVPNVAFWVDIVKSSRIHEVMKSALQRCFVYVAKPVSIRRALVPIGIVRTDGPPPLFHHIVVWKFTLVL